MKILDLNPEQPKVLLLLHPVLGSAELMQTLLVPELGEGYRILLPDLSGHGTAADQTYDSAAADARELHDYLITNGITKIRLAMGASLGALVLMELLKLGGIAYKTLFFEGASFYEQEAMLADVIRSFAIKKLKKVQAEPQAIVTRLTKYYGDSSQVIVDQMLQLSEASIRHIIRDACQVRLPRLSESMQQKCVFAYGAEDPALKRARKLLPNRYPQAKLRIWRGMKHCQKLVDNPVRYAEILKEYL